MVTGGPRGNADSIAVGRPAPAVAGVTLDGGSASLASLRGRPVLVNFWGPSCVPCRQEFPLLAQKLEQHASKGFAVIGVLTDDPVDPAAAFATQYGGTWPTVIDPNKTIKDAYRVAARPQSYFIDKDGVLRSIQIGYLTDADFERQFALIAP